jgi:hypothetical protein
MSLRVALATLSISMSAVPGAAIEFRAGDKVTIPSGEIIADDLYATGDSIVIDGVVQGDIVAVGRHVVLNGAALGDFIAAGQGLVVNGQVADDVRVAGMALRFGESAAVGDDVIGAGFSLETARESVIAGSLVFRGFQALLAGEIRERLVGQMSILRIEGMIGEGGEVAVEGDKATPPFVQIFPTPIPIPTVPAGITLAPEAQISGEIIYTSPHQAVPESGSHAGLVHVEVDEEVEQESLVDRSLSKAWRWVSVLIAGLVLLLTAPQWLERRSDFISARPLAALGWGAAGVVGVPVLVLLLAAFVVLALVLVGLLKLSALSMLTVGAGILGEGSLVFGYWGSLALVAPVIVATWLGRSLRRSPEGSRYLAFSLGWLLLTVAGLVPVLGGVVGALVILFGFGALVFWALQPLLVSDS